MPDTIYVAASGGGVWKSTDAGMTWQSAWPTDVTQAIGRAGHRARRHAVGRHRRGEPVRRRPDVLRRRHLQVHRRRRDVAAVGSARQRGDRPHRRRPDRTRTGSSWRRRARSRRRVSQRGIYRVDNGGKDWKLVLAPPNDTTGGIDVAIDPSNPQPRLRGAVGSQAQQRRPHLRRRRLRPVPLRRRRRHLDAAAEHRRPVCRLRPDRRPGCTQRRQPRPHRRRRRAERPEPRLRRVRLAVRAGQGLLRLQRRRRLVRARRPAGRIRRLPVVVRPAVGRPRRTRTTSSTPT